MGAMKKTFAVPRRSAIVSMMRPPTPIRPLLLFALLSIALGLCAETAAGRDATPGALRIIDRPIPFGETRTRLTLEYARQHYDPAATNIIITPRMIVIHWTATRTLREAYDTFAPEVLPPSRPEIARGGRVNVSAHFLVDRDGAIYRLMPETVMGRHVIGLNHCAIGIENVGGANRPLTIQQLRANELLVRHLAKRFPSIDYLIGHHEYRRFEKHPLWIERDPSYRTVKIDPGPAFMKRLRERVLDITALKPF